MKDQTKERMFADRWMSLTRAERLVIRRTVRGGRSAGDAEQAELAADWATTVRARPWWRIFWLWFVPGVLLALAVAARIHPIVIGGVLVLSAEALVVRRNTAKAEAANRALAARSSSSD